MFIYEAMVKYRERELIFKKSKNFKPDFEGLALRDDGNGEGYLIASVQGSNGYLIIDRKSLDAKIFFISL